MSPAGLSIRASFMPGSEELYAVTIDGRRFYISLAGDGFSPLELALAALGACACIEAYKLLSIRGGLVEEISVDVIVEEKRGESLINLSFHIKADRIGEKEAEETITRLLDKYCSVWHVFRRSVGLNMVVKLKKR
jgi:uncharacterized OsmC-like protein